MNSLKHYLSLVDDIFSQEQFIASPRELYEPIDYTLRLGGKRIRPTLLMAANALFGGKDNQVRDAALGIETFHNFTLLHDDLMDRSPLRRGQPTVYTKWNDNIAILSGDTMYALSWRYFLRQPSPKLQEILQCFCETAIQVCEGQQKDMNFEHLGLANVSLEDYRDMISQKTAVLLAGALKIGALYADAPDYEVEKMYEFGMHLGLAFQMQDDLLDGYGDTAVFGKKTGQDIRDNKISFLPIMALLSSNNSQRNELLKLFASKNNMEEEEKVHRVLDIYEDLNLREKVEHNIDFEFSATKRKLDEVNASEELKKPLRELLETLNGRKK